MQDGADHGSEQEAAVGSQSASNAAGGSEVDSDEAGAQAPNNAVGGSKVEVGGDKAGGAQSDEAGAKSGSNAAGGWWRLLEDVPAESDEAGAPSGEADAQSPSNAAGGAQSGEAGAPSSKDPKRYRLSFHLVKKEGDVFHSKGEIPFADSKVLYDIRHTVAKQFLFGVERMVGHARAKRMQRSFAQSLRELAASRREGGLS